MTTALVVAAYLEKVAGEAVDRPRALAAGILARALRRGAEAKQSAVEFVEAEVVREAGGDEELMAEMGYEIGSILVELRERFPEAPLLDEGIRDVEVKVLIGCTREEALRAMDAHGASVEQTVVGCYLVMRDEA